MDYDTAVLAELRKLLDDIEAAREPRNLTLWLSAVRATKAAAEIEQLRERVARAENLNTVGQ
jgi:hypothetical protein